MWPDRVASLRRAVFVFKHASSRSQVLSFPLSETLEFQWNDTLLFKLSKGLSFLSLRNMGSETQNAIGFYLAASWIAAFVACFAFVSWTLFSERIPPPWIIKVRLVYIDM